jgi:hypothetical protein
MKLGDRIKEKRCPECGVIKPISEFYRRNDGKGYIAYCKPCNNARRTLWNRAHPSASRRVSSAKYLRLRSRVILAYGGKCSCCGFQDSTLKVRGRFFLEVDHIDGKRHSIIKDGGGATLYYKLQKAGFPKGYRVLDAACNAAMEYGEEKCALHKNGGQSP